MQLSLFFDRILSAVTGTAPRPAPPPVPPAAASPEELITRLQLLGLPPFSRISTHRNAQVMLSFIPGRLFRVHEGYAHAPDAVLSAIVRFVTPGIRKPARMIARRLFLDFPAERHAPSPRSTPRVPRVAPADQPIIDRLRQLHESLNSRHFAGSLQPITLRISGRMRQRLGELRMERGSGKPVHIALSRRHIRRDGWPSATETLLHEMVHQWQAETGRPVDHGPEFRRMARQVGITPRAVKKMSE